MNSSAKRHITYFSAPVLCAVLVILSFCFFDSLGTFLAGLSLILLLKGFLKKRNNFHFIDYIVLCTFLSEFIICLINQPGIYAKTCSYSLFFNIVIYFIIREFLQKEKQECLYSNILAGFVILLAVLTIGSFYFFRFNIEYEGFMDLVNFKNLFHPMGFFLNDWATILLLSSSFMLLALARSRFYTLWFWVLVAGLGIVLMGIVFSFSRGAYLSVLVGLTIFFGLGFIFRTVRAKSLLIIFIGVIFLITLSVLPAKKDFVTTIGLSGTTSQVRSTSGRVELWKAALRLIREKPYTGVGNGQFSLRANQFLANREDAMFTGRATNSYLQLLAEKGIIGFIPWLVLVGLLLFTLLRLIRNKSKKSLSALFLFAVIIATLFRELSFSTFFEKQQMLLLFFILAAWIVNQDKNNSFCFSLSRLPLLVILSASFIVLTGYRLLYKIATKRNNEFIEKYQEGNYFYALNSIDKAIKIDPKNPLLFANKGFLLKSVLKQDSLGNCETNKNALSCYRKAFGYSPYDPWLRHNLGWLYFDNGQPDSAEIHFRKACDLSDNTTLFHLSLGIFQEKASIGDHGATEYKKAFRLSPDILDSEFANELPISPGSDFNQMLTEIIDSLAKKTKLDDSPVLKSRLAKVLLHRGDTVRAMQLFVQVTDQLPNLDRPWYYRGMVSLAKSDTVAFMKYLNRAALLDPQDYLYPIALGDYYYEHEHQRDAVYYYKTALVNYANIFTVHSLIAPKWYGYKPLANDVMPIEILGKISPELNTIRVCEHLREMYLDMGKDKYARLVEKYENHEVTISELIKGLNKF